MEPLATVSRPRLMRALATTCALTLGLLLSSCAGGTEARVDAGGVFEPGPTERIGGSCALLIDFDGQKYSGAGNDTDRGVRGERLGTGTITPCTGDEPSTEVEIYAVRGVSPGEKVIAQGWGLLVPHRDDLPDEDTP